jgi:hypothetical protein
VSDGTPPKIDTVLTDQQTAVGPVKGKLQARLVPSAMLAGEGSINEQDKAEAQLPPSAPRWAFFLCRQVRYDRIEHRKAGQRDA